MRKDLENKIDIHPRMVTKFSTLAQFKKWFEETIKPHEVSAEQWFVKLGGKIPKK